MAVKVLQCTVQVFEVEDPEGPLDTPSEDIGQQFGRLQLKTAAELGLPAEQLSELAAAQGDPPQPSLEQDLELWKRHVGIRQGNGNPSHQAACYMLLDCALQGTLQAVPMLDAVCVSWGRLPMCNNVCIVQVMRQTKPQLWRQKYVSGHCQVDIIRSIRCTSAQKHPDSYLCSARHLNPTDVVACGFVTCVYTERLSTSFSEGL